MCKIVYATTLLAHSCTQEKENSNIALILKYNKK